jgi:hypothetical protein
MNKAHLSEKEIQNIALNKTAPGTRSGHLEDCLTCKNKVETYRLIFEELTRAAAPAFNFEVAPPEMIPQRKLNSRRLYVFISASAVLVFVLLAFGLVDYAVPLHSDRPGQIRPQVTWLIVSAAGVLLLGLLGELVNSYHKKIKAINGSVMQHYSAHIL